MKKTVRCVCLTGKKKKKKKTKQGHLKEALTNSVRCASGDGQSKPARGNQPIHPRSRSPSSRDGDPGVADRPPKYDGNAGGQRESDRRSGK